MKSLRWFFITILVIIISCATVVHGADSLYLLMHGKQSALIIAKVTKHEKGKFLVKVEKAISGTMKSKCIEINANFKYVYTDKPLKINDYCILSVRKYNKIYKVAFGAYKVTSSDYKTLKVDTEGIVYGLPELAALQWYINSGGRDKEFYFIGNDEHTEYSAYLRLKDGSSKKIYPLK